MAEYVLYRGKKYRIRRRPSLVEGVPPLIEGDLILKELGIRDISEIKGLEYLTSVKRLDLGENQIKEIGGLENLTELKTLNLSSNRINDIKGLDNLKSLANLSLGKNQITKIDGLELLTNLERLSINENKISEINGLETLKILKKLDLENNQITEINGLDNLKKLRILNLRTNRIKKIKGLENLTELNNLFLQNNQISELKGLENLKWLNLLDVRNNQIDEIKGIENLKNLNDLRLKGNNIPEPIGTTTIKEIGILNVLAHLWIKDFTLDINFKINEFITLKLEDKPTSGIPKKETFIYVKERRFNQCKFLLIPISIDKARDFSEIDSIDEAAEKMDKSFEYTNRRMAGIPVMTEFWGHCSNLQVWAENDYDTRLLHRNLAFPLLKRLTEVGDSIAKKMFREEIAKRYTSGHPSVVEYLIEENYLSYLTNNELLSLLDDQKSAVLRKLLNASLETSSLRKEQIIDIIKNFDLNSLKSILNNLNIENRREKYIVIELIKKILKFLPNQLKIDLAKWAYINSYFSLIVKKIDEFKRLPFKMSFRELLDLILERSSSSYFNEVLKLFLSDESLIYSLKEVVLKK